ncbi:8057_t:CDS:2 [Funneliformis geosporum]|uniref:8057_t:CDS:1 n=1 Tax=Funneliformis geosporum TaxID=1117311 RepID=A0A9W4WLQ0_9GLOM|nr:8057_t:CDS:2 [Funneliformis geosporum]
MIAAVVLKEFLRLTCKGWKIVTFALNQWLNNSNFSLLNINEQLTELKDRKMFQEIFTKPKNIKLVDILSKLKDAASNPSDKMESTTQDLLEYHHRILLREAYYKITGTDHFRISQYFRFRISSRILYAYQLYVQKICSRSAIGTQGASLVWKIHARVRLMRVPWEMSSAHHDSFSKRISKLCLHPGYKQRVSSSSLHLVDKKGITIEELPSGLFGCAESS